MGGGNSTNQGIHWGWDLGKAVKGIKEKFGRREKVAEGKESNETKKKKERIKGHWERVPRKSTGLLPRPGGGLNIPSTKEKKGTERLYLKSEPYLAHRESCPRPDIRKDWQRFRKGFGNNPKRRKEGQTRHCNFFQIAFKTKNKRSTPRKSRGKLGV